jgi:hypothetical protein
VEQCLAKINVVEIQNEDNILTKYSQEMHDDAASARNLGTNLYGNELFRSASAEPQAVPVY